MKCRDDSSICEFVWVWLPLVRTGSELLILGCAWFDFVKDPVCFIVTFKFLTRFLYAPLFLTHYYFMLVFELWWLVYARKVYKSVSSRIHPLVALSCVYVSEPDVEWSAERITVPFVNLWVWLPLVCTGLELPILCCAWFDFVKDLVCFIVNFKFWRTFLCVSLLFLAHIMLCWFVITTVVYASLRRFVLLECRLRWMVFDGAHVFSFLQLVHVEVLRLCGRQ